MSQQIPKVEFITERAKLVAGREQTVDVLIRITPPETSADAARRRPQLNLSIVLDRSGSMGGEKIQRAREATAYCIDQLLASDCVSVVIFDDQIDVLIPSQLATNKEALKSVLAHIHARSATALHEAWVRGGIQVSEHLLSDGINRVLLITDGLANSGLTNTDQIVTQTLGLAERGVSTSTIGIGEDFNEDLLMPMAEAGRGNAWHVTHADDMQRIFAVELEGLIAQVAHTVTLGLVPSDGIRLAGVLNDFELNETGRYKLPNLQGGSPLDVVVQLRVPAQRYGTRQHLLDLRLGYTPQEAKGAEVVKHSFEIDFDTEAAVEALPVNAEVGKAVQLMMNARARREAMAYMDRGDYVSARQVVSASLYATLASPSYDEADVDLAQERVKLEEALSTMDDRSQDRMRRKNFAYDSYSRRTSRKS
ncbi:MAG TPA: VWA domain-containing protein [Pyrinomonadaceae bacterium]|jgi:Ca-activated chloride channel family protein